MTHCRIEIYVSNFPKEAYKTCSIPQIIQLQAPMKLESKTEFTKRKAKRTHSAISLGTGCPKKGDGIFVLALMKFFIRMKTFYAIK